MNALGKTLVVFVAAASIGFAAFAMSLVSGGPNWKGESESAELTNDFVFSLAGGEKPIYSLKARTTGAAVGGSTPLLAEAVHAQRRTFSNWISCNWRFKWHLLSLIQRPSIFCRFAD